MHFSPFRRSRCKSAGAPRYSEIFSIVRGQRGGTRQGLRCRCKFFKRLAHVRRASASLIRSERRYYFTARRQWRNGKRFAAD